MHEATRHIGSTYQNTRHSSLVTLCSSTHNSKQGLEAYSQLLQREATEIASQGSASQGTA